MESEPGRYAGGDDELSRQREKHTSALLAARHPSGRTDRTVEAVVGTGTVVQFPIGQRPGADGVPGTEEQRLNSARRLLVLQKLQAMLLPE